MKTLVTYWTRTGNTRRVAEAIFEALPGEKELVPLDQVQSLDGFDLTVIGFPVLRFSPPPDVREFIARHTAGRKIALFITHAMPSHSEDPVLSSLLEKVLGKCRQACEKSEFAGLFHCQGELSVSAVNEFKTSQSPLLARFAEMRPLTLGHPDQVELCMAKEFALKVITPP